MPYFGPLWLKESIQIGSDAFHFYQKFFCVFRKFLKPFFYHKSQSRQSTSDINCTERHSEPSGKHARCGHLLRYLFLIICFRHQMFTSTQYMIVRDVDISEPKT